MFKGVVNELGQKWDLLHLRYARTLTVLEDLGSRVMDIMCGALWRDKKIIGLNRQYNMIVVGAGNLGQALANYSGFEKEGFNIKALFDINPRLLGMSIRGIDILDIDTMKSYTANNPIDISHLHAQGESPGSRTAGGLRYKEYLELCSSRCSFA